jgi:hypothetical protein
MHSTGAKFAFTLTDMCTGFTGFVLWAKQIGDGELFVWFNISQCKKQSVAVICINPAIWRAGMV